jgi:ribose transport system permease protein
MTFVILTGGIDLSVSSLAAFTGVFTADLIAKGVSTPVTILAGLAVGAIVGIVNGGIVAGAKIAPFVVTLGMTTILRGAAIAYGKGYPISIPMTSSFLQMGNGHLAGMPVPILIDAAALLACVIVLSLTNVGRNVYAIGGNMEAAKLSGVNVAAVTLFAYAVCGVLTALGGMILAARLYTGLPSAGSGLELQAIAGVVLGGTSFTGGEGSVIGTVIGIVLLGVLLNAMVLFGMSADIQLVVQGVIIILAVLYDQWRKRRL